ncbi:MAG: glycosyltransferase family 2 protein [Lachnospiraceae bacterium]|nr:glycosyltransferase family 2 protein [Lachnospiraceae bacterium]MDY6333214.1 glycosyltransferase family 2 protein [Lachnospiraceae bacterium]
MKLLSVAVPCYNSEGYMARCVDSLLAGGDDMEIIIVDDGSTDGTAKIADRYQTMNPNVVRVIHKENGGHGSAVNAGIENATGLYFKVVDSDDWVNTEALREIMAFLRSIAGTRPQLDMLVSNFVYDKVGESRHRVMQYRSSLPAGQMLTWDDTKKFHRGHYILMHSVIYRTGLLRECGLKLPEHCFYVDNLYVFEPLPYVKYLYYLDINFYHYFIGRSDQSVNQKVMISRIDQQIRVNKLMVDYYTDRETRSRLAKIPACRQYMYNYLEIITTISSILALLSYTKEDMDKKKELWDYIRSKDFWLYRRLRTSVLGFASNTVRRGGRDITVGGYKLLQRFYHFN